MADQPDVLITVDNGISSIEGVRAARAAGAIGDHHRSSPAGPRVAGRTRDRQSESAGMRVRQPQSCRRRRDLLRAERWCARSCANAVGSSRTVVEPPTWPTISTSSRSAPSRTSCRWTATIEYLVQQGLRRIQAGKARPGIRALCEASGRAMATLSAADLAFGARPAVECGGPARRHEHRHPVPARGQSDRGAIACDCARRVERVASIDSAADDPRGRTRRGRASICAASNGSGLCVYREGWHQGVVGIVAGRLKDRFARPAIAFADAGAAAPDELRGIGAVDCRACTFATRSMRSQPAILD